MGGDALLVGLSDLTLSLTLNPKPNPKPKPKPNPDQVGLSDGSILQLPLANLPLPRVDLAQLRVTADAEDSAANFGRVRISAVEAAFVIRVDGEPASSTAERPLQFDYSAAHQLLALVNSSGKLMIRRAAEPDSPQSAEETVLGAQMPRPSP